MLKQKMWAVAVATSFLLAVPAAWADDDAMMDVDNHSASFVGYWGYSTAKILYYGDNYRYAWGCGDTCTTPTRTATFTTKQTADISGYYNVYVRHTTASNREETARFNIYSVVSGTPTYRGACYINQTQDGGEWLFCANVYLPNGSYGQVVLGNENTNENEVVIADGVRFVRTGVDGGDILDSSITGNDIATGSIYGVDIADGSITGADIATGAVSSTDILDNSITGADIATGTITSSDIANNGIYYYDIADTPGIEFGSIGNMGLTSISTNCTAQTNLRSIAVTIPTAGYVWVHASGRAYLSTADRWIRVTIDNASGGGGYEMYRYIENTADEATAGAYEAYRDYSMSYVYYESTAGTKYYYLKGCREATDATGTVYWDNLVGTFYPQRY